MKITKPKVELLNHTPLWVCSKAIRTCWNSHDKSDTCHHNEIEYQNSRQARCLECGYEFDSVKENLPEAGTKDKDLIERVGNKNRHSSTLEHLYYNFHISNISRALLQELARHRLASLSVKSTRYTLKELKAEEPFTEYTDMRNQEYLKDGYERAQKYLIMTSDDRVNRMSILALDNLRDLLNEGISNDIVKFVLPEAYKTELSWSINARSLQNFLQLRTSKNAMWEIRNLAFEIYNQLPEEHKYLFKDFVNSND